MSAQTVRYFNGTSKSLDKATLTKLFKGQSKLSLMPYDEANGVTWAGLSFSGADEVYTIRDTFKVNQADSSKTAIRIDQMNETIDTTVEPGDFTFAGDIPSIAASLLTVFYKGGVTISGASSNGIIGQNGTAYAGKSFFNTPKKVYATVLVENEEQDLALAFARVLITIGINKDDNTNPTVLRMSGAILANTESAGTQGDWASLEKYVASNSD